MCQASLQGTLLHGQIFGSKKQIFKKAARQVAQNRLFKESFKCHIWSYALQTIGCKDSLKSKSLMNVIITWQTFKDNATAHAPLFLKWFQLRSKWSIVSLAADEKEKQTPMTNLQFSVKESHSFLGLKTKQNLFFKRQLTKWFLCVLRLSLQTKHETQCNSLPIRQEWKWYHSKKNQITYSRSKMLASFLSKLIMTQTQILHSVITLQNNIQNKENWVVSICHALTGII